MLMHVLKKLTHALLSLKINALPALDNTHVQNFVVYKLVTWLIPHGVDTELCTAVFLRE